MPLQLNLVFFELITIGSMPVERRIVWSILATRFKRYRLLLFGIKVSLVGTFTLESSLIGLVLVHARNAFISLYLVLNIAFVVLSLVIERSVVGSVFIVRPE